MTKERFFDLFGQIDPAYVLAVDEILTQAGKKVIPFSRRKALGIALIAAVIAGLLTVTAYAAGFFGIQARLISSPTPTVQSYGLPEEAEKTLSSLRNTYQREYISLSGVTGSNEYSAAAEWLAFRSDYAEQMAAEQMKKGENHYEWRDLERSFAPDEEAKAICRLYQVWDEAMWLKLREIADKYGLALHTSRRMVPGDEIPTLGHGQYEDGSFLATASTSLEGQFTWFNVYLEKHGALPADDLAAACTDEYEEWEYETARGDRVSIAMRYETQEPFWVSYSFLIFYNGPDVTMTVQAQNNYQPQDRRMDDKTYAERLADRIDFETVAAAETPEEALALFRGGNT